MGLKNEENLGLSEAGVGFLAPKNAAGLGARETEAVLAVEGGLEAATEPEGLNDDADGLGRNSVAPTLNPFVIAELGVCNADLLGLVRPEVVID